MSEIPSEKCPKNPKNDHMEANPKKRVENDHVGDV